MDLLLNVVDQSLSLLPPENYHNDERREKSIINYLDKENKEGIPGMFQTRE